LFVLIKSDYRGWAKKVTLFGIYISFLDALYLQFLFTHVSFSLTEVVLRLPM